MKLLDRIRATDVVRFKRVCRAVALVCLLLAVGQKTLRYELHHLPQQQDYPQYYMAGLIARLDAWDALYPIPHEGSQINPGLAENSELHPLYAKLAEERGVSLRATRFIQPPVSALLFIPLSIFPFKLSWYLWTLLLIFAVWGISRQAGTIYEICVGHASHVAGVLALLICLSPLAFRWVRVGNMSVIVGWLIGYATIELIKRDTFRGAMALTISAIAKYVVVVLGPMYLVMRRWRTIAWSIVLTVLLVCISLIVSGTGPYRTFARHIAPTLGRSSTIAENQSLYPVLLRAMGKTEPPLYPKSEMVFHGVQWLILFWLLAMFSQKSRSFWKNPSHILAGTVALLTWLLIFSPICWEHYHAYLAPFWGWLVYQATRSWVRMILATGAIALSVIPISLLFPRVNATLFGALVLMFTLSITVLLEAQSGGAGHD